MNKEYLLLGIILFIIGIFIASQAKNPLVGLLFIAFTLVLIPLAIKGDMEDDKKIKTRKNKWKNYPTTQYYYF